MNMMVRLVDPSQAHLNWTERWQLDYFSKITAVQCMRYFKNPL